MLQSFLNSIILFFTSSKLFIILTKKINYKNSQHSYKHNNLKSVHINSFFKPIFYFTIAEYAVYTKNYITYTAINADNLLSSFTARFKPKDISLNYLSTFSIFNSSKPIFYFLRKNKLFNKGRYSRNRQTYRTGAY